MRFFLVFILLIIPLFLSAQEEDSLGSQPKKIRKWELGGYVKNMQTVYFIDSLNLYFKDQVLLDNLIHNRLNFKWYISKSFTFKFDLRNRIFTGELMKLTTDFADQVDKNASNPLLDRSAWYSPSWLLLNKKGIVIHSMIDRMYFEYLKGKWEIRMGRQRINWGITNYWNPNDIFNTYNFTDFDYEERPGTDAVRVTYYTGLLSKIEIAVQAFDSKSNINAAALWQFNKKGYDFQLMGGMSLNYLVSGFGWAGNIKKVSFKGEASYFYALKDSVKHNFLGSINADYIFKNSLFINGGFLFNSNGSNSGNISNLFNFRLSARNLYPYRYSLMLAAAYPFTPVFMVNLALVYSPGKSHALFLSPTLSYSIAQNWDFDLVGQIVLNAEQKKYKSPLQLLFLRVKWSF